MIWRIWPVKSSFRFKGTVSHPVCRNPAPDRLFYPPGTATHSSRRVSFLLPFAWYVLYSWAGYPHLVLIEFLSLGGYFTCRKEGCTEASYYRRVQLRSARPQSTRIVQAEWSRNGANVAQSPVHCSKKGREWSNKTDTRFVVKSVLLRITTEQTWTRTSSALMLPFPGFSISVGESSGDPFLFRWMWFFFVKIMYVWSCFYVLVFQSPAVRDFYQKSASDLEQGVSGRPLTFVESSFCCSRMQLHFSSPSHPGTPAVEGWAGMHLSPSSWFCNLPVCACALLHLFCFCRNLQITFVFARFIPPSPDTAKGVSSLAQAHFSLILVLLLALLSMKL